MTDLTPETLAERRALWTELRDRGGQDVILTPEFALSLLDALAAEKVAREEAVRVEMGLRADLGVAHMEEAKAVLRADKAEARADELAEEVRCLRAGGEF